VNADSLANTQIGGPSANQFAFRFRAATSSALQSVRLYIIGGNHAGYGAGTGGTIQATIQTNGASDMPSGTVLATTTFAGTDGAGKLVTFSSPASLTAGTLYHLVFRNIDGSPSANYSSVNSTFVFGSTLSPRQPKWPDTDMAVLLKQGSGGWGTRGAYTPLMDATFANGTHQGNGYMEFWVGSGQAARIGGSDQARETFNNPTARTITKVAARLERSSGSGALTLSLYSGSTLIAQGSVPASSISGNGEGDNGGGAWAVVTIPATVLPAGSGSLVLTAPSGTLYLSHGIRKGGDYGYDSSTYFDDGQAQESSNGGSSWAPLQGRSNGSDFQWYVR
jgi:hypothetical protein